MRRRIPNRKIRVGDKTLSLSAHEVVLRKLRNMAIEGNATAMRLFVGLLEQQMARRRGITAEDVDAMIRELEIRMGQDTEFGDEPKFHEPRGRNA